jgi:hypothetical protein
MQHLEQQPYSTAAILADLERQWNNCRDQLLHLRTVGEGWDGDGACAPASGIIDGIITLIQSDEGRRILRTPPDSVNTLRDGTIALEWHLPHSEHVIMRFDDPVKAQVMKFLPGLPTSSFWQDFSNIS